MQNAILVGIGMGLGFGIVNVFYQIIGNIIAHKNNSKNYSKLNNYLDQLEIIQTEQNNALQNGKVLPEKRWPNPPNEENKEENGEKFKL